ncbi:hypothetical protein RchiOBHm_Chr6g0267591 [Rosa chinensis]|uniref:Uncharacterized protein n=1 Tax=Rosa chinensis TaxID=74649 RepID=A0A2P6PQ23_ROSCH|nr:hypothetical protein RchiOBHm_Chr6g0267591 [Rosa chinensis]
MSVVIGDCDSNWIVSGFHFWLNLQVRRSERELEILKAGSIVRATERETFSSGLLGVN